MRIALGVAFAALLAALLQGLGVGSGPLGVFLDLPSFTLGAACALGAWPLFLCTLERPRRWALYSGTVGVLVLLVLGAHARVLFLGLGAVGMVGLGVASVRRRGSARTFARTRLLEFGALFGFALASPAFLALTTLLHPLTYDAQTFAVAGRSVPFLFGRALAAMPMLKALCTTVYALIPVSIWMVMALATRVRKERRPRALEAFVAVTVMGAVLYHIFPVVGPLYFVPTFPLGEPSVAEALKRSTSLLDPDAARNAMPSLHAAWALLGVWQSRALPRPARAFLFAMFVLTVTATLGLGYHYVADLVVSFPVTLAALVLTSPERRPGSARVRMLWVCAAGVALWLVLLRTGAFVGAPAAFWVASVATVLSCVGLERRIVRGTWIEPAPEAVEISSRRSGAAGWKLVALGGMFFASGFAGLCYEVVFSKSLGLSFGSTARAATLVLAIYMGGIALGAWVGGRWAERVRRPLRAYALLELGIGLWCLMSPGVLRAGRSLYLAWGAGREVTSGRLVLLQTLVALLVLLPMTFLMGLSTPLVGRYRASLGESVAGAMSGLYAVNTLGAALGAVGTGYLLLPRLGVLHATWVAVGVNLAAAAIALALPGRAPADPAQSEVRALEVPARTDGDFSPMTTRGALAMLTVSGFVTFGLETTYVHLLAVVAGNSVYAFSLMTFTFLLGLSLGAAFGRGALVRARSLPGTLASLQLGLALSMLLGVALWNGLPGYFASFFAYPLTDDFGRRELVRAAACLCAMAPPAFLIGASYPLLLEAALRGGARQLFDRAGVAMALNTLGNIAGATVVGLFLLSRLGAVRTTQVLAGMSLLLGLFVLAGAGRAGFKGPAVLAGVVFVVLGVMPRELDAQALSWGANVYFQAQGWGHVIDSVESLEGGMSTVALHQNPGEPAVKTLLTNGKFQGDDSYRGQMAAQIGFSLVPLLHLPSRRHALLIGLGSGVSARVTRDSGFASVDVVELSADVALLAARHFGGINGEVLADPRVQLHVGDGRNFLALTKAQFDFIGLEVSSIWFAGAASLYNREFYELAQRRLSDHGVLQQWVQLHRLTPRDLATIMLTARSVFPEVYLYEVGRQGVLIACASDCPPLARNLALPPGTQTARDLDGVVGGVQALLGARILAPVSFEALEADLRRQGLTPADWISTDSNLMLEYQTPRANVRPYLESLERNLAYLRRFSPPEPL